METEYFGTCEGCGLTPIDADELGDGNVCPQCGSDDLTFQAYEIEVDLYHPGPGPGWGSI